MTQRTSDRFIPWYIVAFFIVQTVLFAWFMHLAHESYPGVVTDKAYEKGLKYNDTIAEAERQEQLGWTSTLTARSLDNGKARVELSLKDRSGLPLPNATITLWFTRPVRSGMDYHAVMTPDGAGKYVAETTLPARGLWEVRAAVEVGDQNYQTSRKVVF